MSINQTLYYLAYGSNLHPLRLKERVPSAKLMFTLVLEQYRLFFEKRGQDNSAKCNIRMTGQASDTVYAAMYQITGQHKILLDAFEGLGAGYIDQQLQVNHQGRSFDCFSYFAQSGHIVNDMKPYHWYKALVLQGAQHLHFPAPYLSSIARVESMPDEDSQREKIHRALIAQMAANSAGEVLNK